MSGRSTTERVGAVRYGASAPVARALCSCSLRGSHSVYLTVVYSCGEKGAIADHPGGFRDRSAASGPAVDVAGSQRRRRLADSTAMSDRTRPTATRATRATKPRRGAWLRWGLRSDRPDPATRTGRSRLDRDSGSVNAATVTGRAAWTGKATADALSRSDGESVARAIALAASADVATASPRAAGRHHSSGQGCV